MISGNPLAAATGLGRNPETEMLLKELRTMRQDAFDAAVREWALDPSREEDRLFAHPAVIRRTTRALERLSTPGVLELTSAQGAELRGIAEKIRRHALRFSSDPRRERKKLTPPPVAAPAKVSAGPATKPSEPSGRPRRRSAAKPVGQIRVSKEGLREIALPGVGDMPPSAVARTAQLRYYLENDKATFEDAVFLWATSGDAPIEDDLAFQSVDLASETFNTLFRLRREAQAQQADATGEELALLKLDFKMLSEVRNELKPFVNLARALKARSKDEDLALKVLRQTYYQAYRDILADLKAKKTKRQAKALAKERKWAELEKRIAERIEEISRPPVRKRPNRRKRRNRYER